MRIKLRPITCLAVPLAAGILVAAAISFPVISAPAPDSKVEIDNFAFSPERITVKAGTTVTWLNADAPHAVASSSNLFKSKAFDTDGSFSFTFTTPGVYEVC
jgi:plastocyanin